MVTSDWPKVDMDGITGLITLWYCVDGYDCGLGIGLKPGWTGADVAGLPRRPFSVRTTALFSIVLAITRPT